MSLMMFIIKPSLMLCIVAYIAEIEIYALHATVPRTAYDISPTTIANVGSLPVRSIM